jgi:Phage integrase family
MRKIPVVLSPEEVARLLEAAPGPKYKAALSAAYAAGLRVSEVVTLKVSDIDSERLLLAQRCCRPAATTLAPRRRPAIQASPQPTFNDRLNHQPNLLLPAKHVTNRRKGLCTLALAPSTSAKSP